MLRLADIITRKSLVFAFRCSSLKFSLMCTSRQQRNHKIIFKLSSYPRSQDFHQEVLWCYLFFKWGRFAKAAQGMTKSFVPLVISYLLILGGFCFNVDISGISSTLWQDDITSSGIKKRFYFSLRLLVNSIKYLLKRYKFRCRI